MAAPVPVLTVWSGVVTAAASVDGRSPIISRRSTGGQHKPATCHNGTGTCAAMVPSDAAAEHIKRLGAPSRPTTAFTIQRSAASGATITTTATIPAAAACPNTDGKSLLHPALLARRAVAHTTRLARWNHVSRRGGHGREDDLALAQISCQPRRLHPNPTGRSQ